MIETRLRELELQFGDLPVKVRLRAGLTGEINTEWETLSPHQISFKPNVLQWRVALAEKPVDRQNVFLYHKTTNRTVYESAKKSCPDVDDVILWNTEGEITETTLANIVLQKHNRLVTPPVKCGLLPGVFRQYLLQRGEIEEEVIHVSELTAFDRIYLINSVRGWISVSLTGRSKL
jgi:para-aminobenzoate synthetase/4-amino-4-deoxychorismate lyase